MTALQIILCYQNVGLPSISQQHYIILPRYIPVPANSMQDSAKLRHTIMTCGVLVRYTPPHDAMVHHVLCRTLPRNKFFKHPGEHFHYISLSILYRTGIYIYAGRWLDKKIQQRRNLATGSKLSSSRTATSYRTVLLRNKRNQVPAEFGDGA